MSRSDLCSFDFFYRKKRVDTGNLGQTKLARVLNTLDLTALGNLNYSSDFSKITQKF